MVRIKKITPTFGTFSEMCLRSQRAPRY